MKISEILFEGPYHIDKDFRPHIKMDNYPSLDGLKRESKFLGTLEKSGSEFNFWLGNNLGVAHVTTFSKDDIGQDRQLEIVNLRFHRTKLDLPIEKELHVDTVYTHPDYRKLGLAGALYIVLARYGFSIVSDFAQYNGGKALWKKLATESDARNYAVRIWSDETSDWIKDENGEPLKYNANNLDEEEIWKDISQHNEATTLLVLQHK